MSELKPASFSPLNAGELGYLVTGVRNAIWTSIEKALQPMDITAAQFVVFNSIARGKGRTIGDLCRLLGYDSGAMTRLLDRIEKKGLLRRVANPDDRRSYLVELTETSTLLVPKARRLVDKVFTALLQDFSDREATALKASLEKILQNAAKAR